MPQAIKDAVFLCKTIMRNGYDAYVINAGLQRQILSMRNTVEVEICTDLDIAGLKALFPEIEPAQAGLLARLEHNNATFLFYEADVADASHPEACVAQFTLNMLKKLETSGLCPMHALSPSLPREQDLHDGFEELTGGQIKFIGSPDETLKHDYLRAIRALRFSANYHLPIESNSWMAIVRSARRVLDYVSVTDFMDEWRKVEAENMWRFAELLFESMILHGLVPELAALSRVRQPKSEDEDESVWQHTLEVMRHYPEELPYDWYGTLACLFHECGKLYAGEHAEEQVTFYQHHRIGAKLARKILKRLRFNTEEVDMVCNLVRNQVRFHFMLTDKGIRRFKAVNDYPRLIEMTRADIKASGGNYTEFNHNMKMLERADIREELLEPLLNGEQIMELTDIKPGPAVGLIRDNLLQAQIAGDVNSVEEAKFFVVSYKEREQL